jgi:hypothetical protein
MRFFRSCEHDGLPSLVPHRGRWVGVTGGRD